MLTIRQYLEHNRLRAWEIRTDVLPLRCFYYTAQWARDFNELDNAAKAAGLTPSPRRRDWVAGFIDRFVAGKPRAELVRNRGFAMDPPFKRLRLPHSNVVELRTQYTRTFGFFACKDVFVAHRLVPVELLKAGGRARPDQYAHYAETVRSALLRHLHPSEIDGVSDADALF